MPQASHESPGRSFDADELLAEGWPLIDAFKQFALDYSEFKGTVFRLPFRTAQQVISSKIKKDAYTVSDALDAVRELQVMGPSILLFLKNIRKLKVNHKNRDGIVTNILSMQASNSFEINESRKEINELLRSSNPDYILKELSRQRQIYSSCIHEYVVVNKGVRHRERWRVVDGFFIDTNEKVVTACRRMIENEEKALPYAGAAWPLDSRSSVTGRIFCFLPVPVQTIIPIQVNGYFDLDDSRQNLFLDPSAHGAAAYRVQWNKELLETSVVQAYIKLMEDLRSDLETNGIDTYYKAFPSPAISDSSWEGWFTASFYKQVSKASVIKVADETSWYLLSETRTLPQELEIVRDAFIQENLLPIPHPPFPEHVQNGFKKNNINVPTLTPRDLRIRLKKNKDINCPIDHAPHTYLQKREFIEQILRFCLSDSSKNEIRGLPLLIDCTNHIRTVGLAESPLYLVDSQRDLEIFAEYPEWFVDPKFARELDLIEIPAAGLLRMDGTKFVKELSEYVSEKNKTKSLKMSTDISGVLTDKWLQEVFTRLLGINLNNLKK